MSGGRDEVFERFDGAHGAQGIGDHHLDEIGCRNRADRGRFVVRGACVDEEQVEPTLREAFSQGCQLSGLVDVEVLDGEASVARPARSCRGVWAVVSRTVPRTFQPLSRNSAAIALPSPREAPMMRAVGVL